MTTPFELRRREILSVKTIAKQVVDTIHEILPASVRVDGTNIQVDLQDQEVGERINELLTATKFGAERMALACFYEHVLRVPVEHALLFLGGVISSIDGTHSDAFPTKDVQDAERNRRYTTLKTLALAFQHLPDTRVNVAHEMFMWRLMEEYGNKQYQVLPGVGELLSRTNVNGMKTDDLKLPFPSFYIEVPLAAGLTVRVHDLVLDEVRLVPIVGIYVSEVPTLDAQRMIQVCTIASDSGKLVYGGWGAYLPPNTKLSDVTVLYRNSKLDRAEKRQLKEQPEAHALLRWLMNFVLYLSSREAVVDKGSDNAEHRALSQRLTKAQGSKREKIKQQLKSLDPEYRIYVGRGITRASVAELLGHREGSSHQTRYWVSSHWHIYWRGEGRTVKEHKWVHAFQKGPTTAPTSNPLRVVQLP